MVEFLIDPSIWMGLLTLIVLDIVLGIDNIAFIAILTDKLPPKKRDRARVIGLLLALIMRLSLLVFISWIFILTQPLFTIGRFSFSGRDLILLLGGIFLLFKAITELHVRLENKIPNVNTNHNYANFGTVVVQMAIFDAVFSLDTVITAIGMVNNLLIMIIAIVIAMIIMLIASYSLTRFINQHQTVTVLCLSFLLMIGFSLIAKGFGFYIPKGYLYAAIIFSILIEIFNQIARRNFIKNQSNIPMNKWKAETIIRMLSSKIQHKINENNRVQSFIKVDLAEEECYIITKVLSLTSRTLHNIMTPRNKITWLNCQRPVTELHKILIETPYNMIPVCDGELDRLIGIARVRDLKIFFDNNKQIKAYALANPAIIVSETVDWFKLLNELHRAKGTMLLISNDYGIVQGLVTPSDILEAIISEFSN